MSEKKALVKLKDGGVVDICTSVDFYWDGCDTCGYGKGVDISVEVEFVNGYAKIVVASYTVGLIIRRAIHICATGAGHLTESEFVDELNQVMAVPWNQFVYKRRAQ